MYILDPQRWKVKPRLWGSQSMVQQAVRDNCEKIYGINFDDIVLVSCAWERTGNRILDYSKNALHGDLGAGADWSAGNLNFSNTSTDNVNLGDISPYLGTGGAELSIFVRTLVHSDGTDHGLLCRGDGVGDSGLILLIADDSCTSGVQGSGNTDTFMFNFGTTSGSGNRVNGISGIRTLNKWHSVCGIMNGADRKLYHNGILNASHSSGVQQTIADNNDDAYLGHWTFSATYQMDGLFDTVLVVTKELTAEQISLLHSRPYGLFEPISRPSYHFVEAEITLTTLGTVQSNLSGKPVPQLNLLLNPINMVLDELASVLTLPTVGETLAILNAVCNYLAEKPELQRRRTIDLKSAVLNELAKIVTLRRGRTIDSQDAVLDELTGIVELLRERIVNPKSAVHDQLANIITILALKSLAIQSAIHEQLASITDLTKESTLAIQNALHEQFATILTLALPGVIDLVVQSALHSELARKANFSIAMLLRPQSALQEQRVLNVVLQLLQKLTAQSAYHDFLAEKITLPGIVLTVKNAVHDALSGKLDIARGRLLDIDSAVHDLVGNIPDLVTAYQLIVLNAVCSLIVGKTILTEEDLEALYVYVAKNQSHIYTTKNVSYII